MAFLSFFCNKRPSSIQYPVQTSTNSNFCFWISAQGAYTAWKVSVFGVFLGTYFPAFRLNTERHSVLSPNKGKYGPKKLEYGHYSRNVNQSLTVFAKGLTYSFILPRKSNTFLVHMESFVVFLLFLLKHRCKVKL